MWGYVGACRLPSTSPATAAAAWPQNTGGLTWANLSDPGNGMGAVMGIFAGEWVVFMVLAW